MREQYIKGIVGARVVTVYEADNYIEIRYEKEGAERSLVIVSQMYGGSMGYGQYFRFDAAPIKRGKRPARELSELISITAFRLYRIGEPPFGAKQEIEMVGFDVRGRQRRFVLRGEIDFDDPERIEIVEGRPDEAGVAIYSAGEKA